MRLVSGETSILFLPAYPFRSNSASKSNVKNWGRIRKVSTEYPVSEVPKLNYENTLRQLIMQINTAILDKKVEIPTMLLKQIER